MSKYRVKLDNDGLWYTLQYQDKDGDWYYLGSFLFKWRAIRVGKKYAKHGYPMVVWESE